MKRIFTTFIFAIIATITLMAKTYTPQTVPNPRDVDATAVVCNPDSIISIEEVMKLESIAAKIDSLSEVELAVVALKDIGEADAFDFAVELFNTWGIGKKEKNTGVLLFISGTVPGQRDFVIMTGDGIEGILTDAECTIIRDESIEFLAKDQYGAGLIKAAKMVGERVTTQEALEELLLDSKLPEPSGAPWSGISNLLTIGLGIFGIHEYRKKKCPQCNKRTLKVLKDEVTSKATYTKSGKGIRHYQCTKCGHTFSEAYTIPRKVQASSSSSSSYGGGSSSFGGGGSYRSSGGGSFGGGHTSGGGARGKF